MFAWTPSRSVTVGGKGLIVVLQVLQHSQSKLLLVGEAGRLPGLLARLCKDREKYRSQNRDNSYHNEQFDQREPATAAGILVVLDGQRSLVRFSVEWRVIGVASLFHAHNTRQIQSI